MKEVKLKVEYVPIDSVKKYCNNAKLHPKEQIEQIKKSIENFGMNEPIGIWNNEIVEGHGRILACKELGYKQIPVIKLDHLTDEERKSYIIAHNKLTMNSDFDIDILRTELENLKELDFDLELTGFNVDELDDILGKNEEQVEIVEDDFEVEVPEEPKAKLGDIYQLGNHRSMCGDSTKQEDVDKLMNGVKADMMFTDPPYGMNLDTDYSGMINNLDFAKEKNFTGGKKYKQGIVDDFKPQMIDAILNINAKETFIWGANYFAELIPNRNDGSWVVWDKRSNNNDDIDADYSSDKMYGSCFELCWSKNKHKQDIARIKGASVFGTEQEFDHKRYHPTQKPIKLVTWFLNRYSKENENICDLFGGSGSTLIACEQLNRKCYVMELDPHYVDVIIERWENFTGQKAKLLKGV